MQERSHYVHTPGAQRDFFGAHIYRRTDRPGTFHTLWSGDRTEVDIKP